MPKTTHSNTLMASRLNLADKVLNALGRMANDAPPLLLVFWGSRGSGKTTFLEEVKKRLSAEADVGVAGLWDMGKTAVKGLPSKILKSVEKKKETYKAVIFDNMDVLLKDPSGRDFFDLETNLILPLVERGDTLIIVGSQLELTQWQEYDVRLRQENYQLGPLSRDEVRDMLKGGKPDAETVHNLTFGHPKVMEEYLTHRTWKKADAARFASKYFLEDLPAETEEIAQIASLFPAFNVYILKKSRGDGDSEDDGLLARYNGQINELTRRWIIRFDTDSGAYRFTDNAVRRLLALDYALKQPKRFAGIQHIAADYFEEEAKSAAFLPQLIVSAVYHQAQTVRAQAPDKRGAHCVKWVRSMRDHWNGANWKQVLQKWESADGDPELKDEILSLIGEKYHKKIAAMFSTYREEMEA